MKTLATLIKIGGWCAVVGASLSLILGTFLAYRTNVFKDSAVKAEGEVIQLVERKSEEDGLMFSPVFSFDDLDGRSHTIYSSTSTYPPSYDVGEKVVVYYDPAHPERAKVDGFFSLWGGAAIAGIVSLGNYIVGIVLLLIARAVSPKRVEPPAMPGF